MALDILKPEELRPRNLADLESLARSRREEIIRLKLGVATGEVKGVADVRQSRRALARILTVIGEMKRGEMRARSGFAGLSERVVRGKESAGSLADDSFPLTSMNPKKGMKRAGRKTR